jgi:hypothetical protein
VGSIKKLRLNNALLEMIENNAAILIDDEEKQLFAKICIASSCMFQGCECFY